MEMTLVVCTVRLLETSYLKGWPSLFKCTNVVVVVFLQCINTSKYIEYFYFSSFSPERLDIKWYKKVNSVTLQAKSIK